MGRSRNATPVKSPSSKSNGGRKGNAVFPLDVSNISAAESTKTDHASPSPKGAQVIQQSPSISRGKESPTDADRRGSKDVFLSGSADASGKVALTQSASGIPGRPPHGDSGMFSQQLQRLRARLQSVVQGVREVAQSLDEPHTLIANVRDQLQSRQEASLRRSSLSSAQSGFAGAGPTLSRNSSISRNSTGGMAAFKGALPDAQDSETDVPASPYDTHSGSGAPVSSVVRARVAAVERRSRSGGGLSEPLAVLPANTLPIVPETAATTGILAAESDAMEDDDPDAATAAAEQDAHVGPSAAVDSDSAGERQAAAATPAPHGASHDAAAATTSVFADPAAQSTPGPRSLPAGDSKAAVAAPAAPADDGVPEPEACASPDVGTRAGPSGAGEGPQAQPSSSGTPAPGDDVPGTMRELWTLRARVRTQEEEIAAMIKQLSTKNAQLDQAQTTVQQKDKELSALTRRLSGVLLKLQGVQANHGNAQQDLLLLQALQLQLQQLTAAVDPQQQTPGASAASHPVSTGGSPADAAATEGAPSDATPVTPAPFTVAAARASLLAGIPEAGGVMTFQGSVGPRASPFGAAAGLQAPAPSLAGPAVEALAGLAPRTSTASVRRNSAGMPQRMLSTRDTGASLEVSLPPPPSMWGQGEADEDGEEEEEEGGAGGLEDVAEDQEELFAASLQSSRQLLASEVAGGSGDQGAAPATAAAAAAVGPVARAFPAAVSAAGRESLLAGVDVESCSSSVNSASLPVLPAPAIPAVAVPASAHAGEAAEENAAAAAPALVPAPQLVAQPSKALDVPADARHAGFAAAIGSRPLATASSVPRRRGLLGYLVRAVPTAAFLALLLRDPNVRQGLERLRCAANHSTGGLVRRASSPARRRIAALVAAARAEPLDVSRYLSQPGSDASTEPFESEAVRQCKATWCSIIRPPSAPSPLYY